MKEGLASADVRRDKARSETEKLQRQLEDHKKGQDDYQSSREAEDIVTRGKLKVLEEEMVPNLEKERLRIEKKLEKATELARTLHKDLDGERSVTMGLLANIAKLKEENEKRRLESESMQAQVKDLSEQLQDVMFSLSAQAQIVSEGGVGGDVVVSSKPKPPLRQQTAKAVSRRQR